MTKRIIPFGDGALTRTSGAFHPETGEALRANKPRISPNRIPRSTYLPKVYFHFPGSTTQMQYEFSQGTNNLVDRQIAFEAAFPQFARLVLGTSFQGRDIVAYRLGPVNRKHFVVVQGVNGDEIDGADGAFKAMEILAGEAEFGDFRSEWTIFFIPTLNPDGWFLDTRNLAQTGPNSQTINLNRNFDWFFDQYIELATESKGASAGSTSEASALLSYFNTGDGGNPVTFGFLMDLHSNDGVLSRYQARDRVWRGITGTPENPLPIPGGHLEVFLDFYVARIQQALVNVRARTQGGPDFFSRPLRTRFTPRLHQFFSSQGVPSMEVSDVKTGASNGQETFQTASNFRMDYIIAAAAAVTANKWTFEDAIIIERGNVNLLTNADWGDWDTGDANPSGYNRNLASILRSQQAPEVIANPDRHFQAGESGLVTAQTGMLLPVPAEFTRAADLGFNAVAELDPTNAALLRLAVNEGAIQNKGVVSHSPLIGMDIAGTLPDAVDIFGGGTAAPDTGMVTTVSRITGLNTASPIETVVGNLLFARMFHTATSNLLTSPSLSSERVYIIGGFSAPGVRATQIFEWDPNTNLASNFGSPLGLAQHAAALVPPLNQIFIFAGSDVSGLPIPNLWRLDLGTGAVTALNTIDASLILPVGLLDMTAVWNPKRQTIWAFGGTDNSGNFNTTIFELDPFNLGPGGLTTIGDLKRGVPDDEAIETTGFFPDWAVALGRHSGALLVQSPSDSGRIYVFGGRLTNTVGSLQDETYEIDPAAAEGSGAIGIPDETTPAEVRPTSVVIDTREQLEDSDDFGDGTLDKWTQSPLGVWSVNGSTFEAEGQSGSAFIILDNVPNFINQTVRCLWRKTGSDAIPDTAVICRGTWVLPNLRDGYRIVYDDTLATQAWRIERLNGFVTTVIATLDVSADVSRQIITSFRQVVASCRGTSPVEFNVTFNGLALFTNVVDVDTARITDIGQVAIEGGGPP